MPSAFREKRRVKSRTAGLFQTTRNRWCVFNKKRKKKMVFILGKHWVFIMVNNGYIYIYIYYCSMIFSSGDQAWQWLKSTIYGWLSHRNHGFYVGKSAGKATDLSWKSWSQASWSLKNPWKLIPTSKMWPDPGSRGIQKIIILPILPSGNLT